MPSILKTCRVPFIAGPCTFVSSPSHLPWRMGIATFCFFILILHSCEILCFPTHKMPITVLPLNAYRLLDSLNLIIFFCGLLRDLPQAKFPAGEQQETFPRAGLLQHFVPGPWGQKGSKAGSSLVPVPVLFISSSSSGLACASAQMDPFEGQTFDFLPSLSWATVTC